MALCRLKKIYKKLFIQCCNVVHAENVSTALKLVDKKFQFFDVGFGPEALIEVLHDSDFEYVGGADLDQSSFHYCCGGFYRIDMQSNLIGEVDKIFNLLLSAEVVGVNGLPKNFSQKPTQSSDNWGWCNSTGRTTSIQFCQEKIERSAR